MRFQASILVVDDDPVHLRIYGWIMKTAGFRAVAAQVLSSGVSLPEDDNFDAIMLDYRLTGTLTAVEAAQQIREKFPETPIIILSDMFEMPDDIAPYAAGFVRKGDPEKLIEALSALLKEKGAGLSGGQAS